MIYKACFSGGERVGWLGQMAMFTQWPEPVKQNLTNRDLTYPDLQSVY